MSIGPHAGLSMGFPCLRRRRNLSASKPRNFRAFASIRVTNSGFDSSRKPSVRLRVFVLVLERIFLSRLTNTTSVRLDSRQLWIAVPGHERERGGVAEFHRILVTIHAMILLENGKSE